MRKNLKLIRLGFDMVRTEKKKSRRRASGGFVVDALVLMYSVVVAILAFLAIFLHFLHHPSSHFPLGEKAYDMMWMI